MSYYFRLAFSLETNDKELILILTDTGTHSDIFGW